MDREHDGNCRGRLPGRLDERRRWRENHVHMHAHKPGRQRGQLIDVLRPTPFDDDVRALDVAEVTQARPQPLTCGTLKGKPQKPDARRSRPLLRECGKRPRCRAAKQCYEVAPLHSITSSARASSVGGTSRPSALAVLRLMISSNLVGYSTGKSAGLAPLRILST